MKMVVNKKLLPVKLEYFFKCACIAIIPYLPPLVRQKGVPPDGVGRMWSLFPIFTISTMMIISNLADRFNFHRKSFLATLFVMLLAEIAICFAPDIPSAQHKINNNETIHTTLKIVCHQQEVTQVIFSDPEAQAAFCQYWNDSQQSSVCNTTCNVQDIETIKLHDNLVDLISSRCTENGTEDVNIQRPFNFENETGVYNCDNHLNVTCDYWCKEKENDNLDRSMSETVLYFQFWLLLVSLLLYDSSQSISNSLCDTASLQLLGEERNKFGMQRVWGTLGWGIMALIYGAVMDFFSHSPNQRNYTSAFILSMILFVPTFLIALQIKFLKGKTDKEEVGSVLEVVKSVRVVLFLMCILVIGTSMGCIATFLFIQIEDVAMAWDPEFKDLNLLQGLCISIGCFFGEVPAMFLSAHIIKWLGNIYTFAFVLAVFSTRFILYAFVTNPWLFLPIEITHGVCFGIFYPNMSAYANKMAPPGRFATMQGLVKSTLDIGTSLGALIGGESFKLVGGFRMFLYVGLADGIFMFLYIFCHFLLDRQSKVEPENEETTNNSNEAATTTVQEKVDFNI